MSVCSTGTAAKDKRAFSAVGGATTNLLSWGPEPLAVPPQTAWQLLGICNTTGYKLIAAGELDSFLVGRARRITMASIRRLIERRLTPGQF
jgi:hypothetical protein